MSFDQLGKSTHRRGGASGETTDGRETVALDDDAEIIPHAADAVSDLDERFEGHQLAELVAVNFPIPRRRLDDRAFRFGFQYRLDAPLRPRQTHSYALIDPASCLARAALVSPKIVSVSIGHVIGAMIAQRTELFFGAPFFRLPFGAAVSQPTLDDPVAELLNPFGDGRGLTLQIEPARFYIAFVA